MESKLAFASFRLRRLRWRSCCGVALAAARTALCMHMMYLWGVVRARAVWGVCVCVCVYAREYITLSACVRAAPQTTWVHTDTIELLCADRVALRFEVSAAVAVPACVV